MENKEKLLLIPLATRKTVGIWAVKFRFLLISKNILKNNATARRGYKTKDKNMASRNIDYTIPDLTDFLAMI